MALGASLFFVSMSIFAFGGQNLANYGYVVVSGILTALAWWWAVRAIKARNAAGKTLAQLQALTPDQFEDWTGARLRELGYSVKVTGLSGDHGVDLVTEKGGAVAVVQCKNYRSWSVGEPVLRDLFGAMHDFKATKAYLVTTGRLTRAAVDWIRGKPIEVWDGEHLAGLARRAAASVQAPFSQTVPSPDATGAGSAVEPEAVCPKCGSALVRRRNRSTGEEFLACPLFPDCRYTRPLTTTG